MKKGSIIGALLSIFTLGLVSAGPVEGLNQVFQGLTGVVVVIIGFISDLILNIDQFDEFLFARILLFVLMYLVVYTVLKKNEILTGDKKVNIIIAAAISILAIRFLPNNFVQGILLPYSALGIGISTFLPLIIFFFFLSYLHKFLVTLPVSYYL